MEFNRKKFKTISFNDLANYSDLPKKIFNFDYTEIKKKIKKKLLGNLMMKNGDCYIKNLKIKITFL